VKPLLSVISYNRKEETRQTLKSLWDTGAFGEAEVFVFDNGSIDGTAEMLQGLVDDGLLPEADLFCSPRNIGCPRALNVILQAVRRPGQHFVKVDNDVVLETKGWVSKLVDFLDQHEHVAMASAWYDELADESQRDRIKARRDGWIEAFPIVGHCVIHRGDFLDRTGYFDVLAPDHLYGFEDTLMAHRAAAMRLKCAIVPDVRLRNIQRHSSLDTSAHDGERMVEHVERLRPEYDRRVQTVHEMLGRYYVGPNGEEKDA
jgi:glycosyltransferase involved in cell wall biosynthesis